METKTEKSSLILSFLFKIGLLALLYFVAAKFGLSLAFTTKQVTTVWPPTGIAIAVLLLFGFRYWPGIFIGAFIANLSTHEPILVALGIAVGNTLEAVMATYLLRLVKFDIQLKRIRDVLSFIFLAAMASTALSATIGVLCLIGGGLADAAGFWPVWSTWWVGDTIGALIFAPLILSFAHREEIQRLRSKFVEFACLLILQLGIVLVVFNRNVQGIAGLTTVAYVVLPFIIWSALRFEQIGVATLALLASTTAVVATVLGFGPFAIEANVEQNLIILQVLIFILAATSLFLAAAISERRAAKAEADAKEEKWRSLIEFSYDVVCLIDSTANINYASPSVKQVLGYSQKEFGKMNGLAIVHPDDVERAKKILGGVAKRPARPFRIQVRVRHKNATWRWVEATLTNLIEHPSVRAIVVNFRDITVEKEVDVAKTEFVSLASHQLRTPLTILKWYLSVLLGGKELTQSTRENYLQQVYGANQRMIELVDSLLNVSRLELGRMTFKPQLTDAGKIILAIAKQFEILVNQKHIVLKLNIAKNVPKFKVDPDLLQMILQNLVSNAVKYTPENGSIDISIRTEKDKAVLTVSDTGIGIPKEEQSKVFEKFHRADKARSLVPDGNGLGLYIVSKVVTEMGGKLKLESDGKTGTTFHVIIPLHK